MECPEAFLKVFSLGAVLCPRKASPIKLLPQKKQFKLVSTEDIASTAN